jgi:hypothetical protein
VKQDTHSMRHSFVVLRVASIRIAAPPGPQLSPEAGAAFCQRSLLSIKKNVREIGNFITRR